MVTTLSMPPSFQYAADVMFQSSLLSSPCRGCHSTVAATVLKVVWECTVHTPTINLQPVPQVPRFVAWQEA